MITLDTSVLADLFLPVEEERKIRVKEVIKIVEGREVEIYNPKIFVIEFMSILRRFLPKDMVKNLRLSEKMNFLEENEIFEIARRIALQIHPRAIDTYFIATAKLTDSILISNDKTMVDNSREAGIEAYYLIEEHDRAVKRLKEL